MDNFALLHGDCLEQLRSLPSDSLDSLVTDPPAGIGFMNKNWDSDKGGRDHWIAWLESVMRECLRVLKPGAHGLVWALPRTSHWTATACENAGFEVRDVVTHVFGSGFPKSLDVSKAMGKMRSEDHEPVRKFCRAIRAAMDAQGLKSRDLVQYFDGCHPRLIDHWAARDTDSQPALPTVTQWATLKRVLGLDSRLDREVERLNRRKGEPGDAFKSAEVVGSFKGDPGGFGAHRFRVSDGLVRAPATEAAKQWQGFGTALKPASEHWILVRKPIGEKTVAANVLRWGTGALAIDASRIGTDAPRPTGLKKDGTRSQKVGNDGWDRPWKQGLQRIEPIATRETTQGRWPANLVLDEEAAQALDAQSGTLQSGSRKPGVRKGLGYHGSEGDGGPEVIGSSGGASRFFYCAKASKKDKGADNTHPTVKSTALMSYLITLVTPPEGVVLDPFTGSGSTGVAALREGFSFIGIEQSEEYVAIAESRMSAALEGNSGDISEASVQESEEEDQTEAVV